MVKVIKRDGKLEAFKAAKIVRVCTRVGIPLPIAKAVAAMISSKIKNQKAVYSNKIRSMVFDVCITMGKAPALWKKFEAKKRSK